MTWFFVFFAALASVYPLVDLVAPGTAIRLQMRSTERRDSSLGRRVQGWAKIDPGGEAWKDAGARRRVRLLGAGLLVAVWAVTFVLIATLG